MVTSVRNVILHATPAKVLYQQNVQNARVQNCCLVISVLIFAPVATSANLRLMLA